MSEVEKLIPTKRIAESILRISNGEVSTNLIEQLATDYLAADKEIATKDADLARLREALELEKENSLMAQGYAHDNGLYAARTGVQEVFVSPDGEILHDLMEGEKPFCRIEYYEDSGDDSVGIPSVSFWTLAENQEGTELLDVIALKSHDSEDSE